MMTKADLDWPPIWQMLSDAGLNVGVFGSLHSSKIPKNVQDYSFYVPDFFDDQIFAHPEYIMPFQRFNLGMTRRSARNVDTNIPRELLIEFLRSLFQLGISGGTIAAIVRQILSERMEPRLRIRRRSLQTLIMGDIFVSLINKTRPDFATFYTNHVAAAMHRYWAASFPDDYENRSMTDEWINQYNDEIFDSMRKLESVLGRVVQYCDKTKSTLLVATSMGQVAVPHQATRQFVTIKNVEKFMSVLGFEPEQYRQRHAMVPCGGVILDPELQSEMAKKLDLVSVDGASFVMSDGETAPLSYGLHDGGFVSLYSYFENYSGSEKIHFDKKSMPFEDAGFGYTEHEDGVSVTAHHSPDGMLLVYNPNRPASENRRPRISTTEIAPAVLSKFGIPLADYMNRPSAALSEALGSSRS
jgi:hypothetical protein